MSPIRSFAGSDRKDRNWIGEIFKMVVGLAVLIYIFRFQTRFREVATVITDCKISDVILALFLFVITKIQISTRIFFISRHYIVFPFKLILRDVFIANLFNTVLPVGSGEIYRIKELARDRSSLLESAAIVTLDRAFGLSAILTIGTLAPFGVRELIGLFNPLIVALPVAIGSVAFIFVGTYLKRQPVKNRWIKKFQLFFTYCHEHTCQAILLYLYSLVIIFTLVAAIFFLGKGLGLNLGMLDFLSLYPFVLIATLIPVSIGGLGVRELATISAFGILGVPKAQCVSLGLMQYAMMLVVAIIGLIFFMGRKRVKTQ